jgi:hypothetical protein
MTDVTSGPPSVEARKHALEALATLVNIKKIAADRILRPAGIPDALIARFIKGKDASTGEPLTKRQAGALILEELARNGSEGAVIRRIIEIASEWDAFDLAQDEYKARAVVQKARDLKGVLAEADARERPSWNARLTSGPNVTRKNATPCCEGRALSCSRSLIIFQRPANLNSEVICFRTY